MAPLPFETDDGPGHRAVLGLIVLQADEAIEGEFRRWAGFDGVALHHSRVPSGAHLTAETIRDMETALPEAAGLLPESCDAIGYACTSGATIIGEDRVVEIVGAARPGAAVTDPLTAVKAALRTLGLTRIGFVTPYVADVSGAMRRNLEEAGLRIVSFGSFEQSEERIVARIAPASILQAVLAIGGSEDCEAVFVSCTNLRTLDIIGEAEATLGKPVISSNQALAWHMLRLEGIADRPEGLGTLFRQPLSN